MLKLSVSMPMSKKHENQCGIFLAILTTLKY